MKGIPIRRIKPKRSEPALSTGLGIQDLEELLGPADMVQELHRHDFYFLLVLRKGKGAHEIDFTSYKVADHSLFLMRPGQVHQLSLKQGSTGFLVQFHPDFYSRQDVGMQEVLRRASAANHYRIDARSFSRIATLLDGILHEYNGEQPKYEEAIRAGLDMMFIELMRQNRAADKSGATSYQQERLEEFQQLLQHHLREHLQVANYAGMMHLSPYQLNAITAATLGKSCLQLINEALLLEAKRQLLATSRQVSEIAWDLGYEDPSYFIRFFKKHFGYTPEAFRNNFK
jgi:AraC-like DNA-binding protein